MVETTMTLVYLIMFYGTLAWYFDNVLPNNRGVPKPWWFIFDPTYWLPCLKSTNSGSRLELR